MEREIIKVKLSDGSTCFFEVDRASGREKVSTRSSIFDFSHIKSQVKSLSEDLAEALKSTGATKTTLEFGIEMSVDSGQLTSLILKGSGTANIKVTLEWEHTEKNK